MDEQRHMDTIRRRHHELWYFAHPVWAATASGVDANIHSARMWLRHLISTCPDVVWVAPWLHAVELGGGGGDAGDLRARGLAQCAAVVQRCHGLVACGHEVTAGMRVEVDVAISAVGARRVMRLTTMPVVRCRQCSTRPVPTERSHWATPVCTVCLG